MVSVVLAIVLALVPLSVQATTYYVMTTGSNSNDGLSESTPFLTMQKCVDVMVAGDTCNVGGGTYSATGVQFKTSGSSGAPITLQAFPGATPILSCTSATNDDTHAILFKNSTGFRNPIGWINVTGIEVTNCYNGIKFTNLHDSIISNMHLHHNANQGILGAGGARVSILQNHIHDNGPLGASTSNLEHGIYIVSNAVVIRRNLIYNNQAYGIQIDGTKTFTAGGNYASVEFATSANWIIESNTIAYNRVRAGIVVWGSSADGTRIENNIIYENATTLATSEVQGVNCTSCTGSTGLIIKNNHYYGSGSGGQVGNHASLVGTISDNVVNVSAPAFVNGGSNSLPASPDFRLTARAPVDIALVNEFSHNGVAGAFQPPSTPTASITTNKMTLNFPFSTAVPVQNLSTAGVTFTCTANVCPGSPVVSSVSKVTGTDSNVDVAFSGITSDACLVHADAVTISYASGSGTWTGNDNIGPYPGLHQQILSFANLSVTNNCTGSGPAGYPGGALQILALDGNANDSSGNANHGTVTGGSFVTAKVGQGFQTTNGATDRINLNYGSGVDPSATSFTIAFGVNVTTPTLNRIYGGADLGTNQRLHWGTFGGTWGLGVQASALTTTSDLAATSGDHYVVIQVDAAADTVTICVDGVTATSGSGVKSITSSYTLASHISLGLPINFATSNTPTAVFDETRRYSGVVSCSSLYNAWNAPAVPPGGTFTQAAIQFQGIILDAGGSPIVVGPSVQTIEVPAGGGAVLLFQVHCENVTDCEATAFKLVYAQNGGSTWQQVPDIETADGTWMWGASTVANLNNGVRSTRLTGSCALTNGATQLTSAQTPSVDLPQDGCTVQAYIVRVGATHARDYYDYKLRTESDADFTIYTQTARILVVNPMASGIGF